jgi:hypothetical protein
LFTPQRWINYFEVSNYFENKFWKINRNFRIEIRAARLKPFLQLHEASVIPGNCDSYDIIKAHGGELRVESKEGDGAVFVMLIPYA